MADQQTADLPEGTDSVIEGAGTGSAGDGVAFTSEPTENVVEREIIDADSSSVGADEVNAAFGGSGGSSGGGFADRLRSGREQFVSQAGDRTRGLVTQGLERTAEALANVSRMVGDTAPGIEERLGADYGEYARRAAGAIENVANNIAEKDPDELIDDTRNFVRNSPGVALAGAAVVGFLVTRLLKTGIAAARGDNGGETEEADRA